MVGEDSEAKGMRACMISVNRILELIMRVFGGSNAVGWARNEPKKKRPHLAAGPGPGHRGPESRKGRCERNHHPLTPEP